MRGTPHSHVELYSAHQWGDMLEWHSSFGPDGWSGLAGYSDHIHSGNPISDYDSPPPDSVSEGQIIGWLGGWTTAFLVQAN